MLAARNMEQGCLWEIEKGKLTKIDDMFVMGYEEGIGSVVSLGFNTGWKGEWQIIKKIPEIAAGFVQDGKGKRKRKDELENKLLCHTSREILFKIIHFSTLISWIQKLYKITVPLFPIPKYQGNAYK